MVRSEVPSPTEFQVMSLIISERTGREIAHRYQKVVGKPICYGTLYATLRRLKDEDWATTRVRKNADGRVRYFRLTGSGVKSFTRGREYYQQLCSMAEVVSV